MRTASWRLSLLGVPRLQAPDGRTVRCEGKPLALLSLLALEGRVTRARLADLLWPGVPEATARNNLVILLRRFRQALGAELWQAGERLTLQPEVEVDVQPLLNASAGPEPGLYRSGPLLEGQDWPELPDYTEWLLAWRERLDAARARQALNASAQAEAASRYREALDAARHALTWNPVSEETHRAVMRLSYLNGDPAAALLAYETCCTVLRERLRTEPLPPTHELAALIRRGGALPVPPSVPVPPSPVLRPERLVGRAGHWARMEEAWAAGQAIILVGDAGAGKSRLAQDFVASKGQALLFEGRPGDITVPYATAARNLRRVLAEVGTAQVTPEILASLSRVLPELRAQIPLEVPGAARDSDEQLHRSIRTVLGLGLAGKAAVISDDMQYSDDASIEVSALLSASAFPLGRPGSLPNIVVCYRRGELAARHAAALSGLVGAGHAVQIEVGPLDDAGVAALLETLRLPEAVQLGEGLARLSGGNPMYVLEAARHLLQAGSGEVPAGPPPRLEQLVARRLERLPAGALPVARAASVLQRDFTTEQIAGLLGLPLLEAAAAWDELERAEIVVGDRFSHDLVAEAILNQIPAVVRRLLHRAAARTLALHHSDPARVARHWLDGGDELEAAPWLVLAGAAARRGFRRREAADFLDRAAGIYARFDRPGPAFEAAADHLDVLADLDDPGHQGAAEALLERAQSDGQRARASVQLCRALVRIADSGRLAAAAHAGLAQARAAGDLDSEAELQEALAIVALLECRLDDALAPLQRMRQIGERTGSLDLQARAEENLGLWAAYHDLPQAAASLQRAEALNVQRGARERAASSADKLARVQFELGEVRAAQTSNERAARHLEGLDGSEAEKLSNLYGRLVCLQALGKLGAARALGAEMLGNFTARGHSNLGAVQVAHARSLFLLGEFEAALTQLEETRHSPTFSGHHSASRAVEQALVLTALERPAEADTCLDEAEALLATLDDVYLRVRLLLARAARCPAAEALPILGTALDLARSHGLAGAVTAVLARQAGTLLNLNQCIPVLEPREPYGGVISAQEWQFVRFRTLQAAGATEAMEALQDAWTALHATAGPLGPAAREIFLTRIPLHRAILAAGAAQGLKLEV